MKHPMSNKGLQGFDPPQTGVVQFQLAEAVNAHDLVLYSIMIAVGSLFLISLIDSSGKNKEGE